MSKELTEILEYLAEGYYPEHEYGTMWQERNAESVAGAAQEVKDYIDKNYKPQRPLDKQAADAKLRELWENTK